MIVLLVPVLLLPLTTAVPTWLWAALLLVDLALIILLPRRRKPAAGWGFGGLAVVVAVKPS